MCASKQLLLGSDQRGVFVIYLTNTCLLAWRSFPSSREEQIINIPVRCRDAKTERCGGCKSPGLEMRKEGRRRWARQREEGEAFCLCFSSLLLKALLSLLPALSLLWADIITLILLGGAIPPPLSVPVVWGEGELISLERERCV